MMKKIYLLLPAVLLFVSCMRIDYAYPRNYVYVNNSGVEVAIVGKNNGDRYSDVPDSLVLLNGASYVIPGGYEEPGPYEANSAETNNTVKIYFNKKTLVIHNDESYFIGIRDIRRRDCYVFSQTGKRSGQFVYTFTPEDYQNALKQE